MSGSSTTAPAGGQLVLDLKQYVNGTEVGDPSGHVYGFFEKFTTMEIILLLLGAFEKCFLAGYCLFTNPYDSNLSLIYSYFHQLSCFFIYFYF